VAQVPYDSIQPTCQRPSVATDCLRSAAGGAGGTQSLRSFDPPTVSRVPASRELVYGRHLPLYEAVGWPRPPAPPAALTPFRPSLRPPIPVSVAVCPFGASLRPPIYDSVAVFGKYSLFRHQIACSVAVFGKYSLFRHQIACSVAVCPLGAPPPPRGHRFSILWRERADVRKCALITHGSLFSAPSVRRKTFFTHEACAPF